MTACFWTGLLFAASAFAQDPQIKEALAKGTVSGTVLEAGTGKPLPEVDVWVNRGTQSEIKTVTDSQGHYRLNNVEPGNIRVTANAVLPGLRMGGPYSTRTVALPPGGELSGIDFRLVFPGEISGKVVDQNKEPVPGISVFLITREYTLGSSRAFYQGQGTTDDQGEYHIQRVTPGRTYVLMAERRILRLDAISEAPEDVKLRRPAYVPTFYPNATSMDGGQPIVLRAGEHREGMDIRLARSPSYCIEGVIDGPNGPAGLAFSIVEQQATSGSSGDGGFFMSSPGGKTGPDGKVRICDLAPGDYQITAMEWGTGQAPPPTFGYSRVTIANEDYRKLRVVAQPRFPISGEVVWDGVAPPDPLQEKLSFSLRRITGAPYMGEDKLTSAESSMPGEFLLPGVLMEEYSIQTRGLPRNVYIKEMTYGNQSVLHAPLRVGASAGGSGLRVVLARDGGTVNVKVNDKDGNPVGDCGVVLMPANAASEAALAAAMLTGKTTQRGTWSPASVVAPGKYYVLATSDTVDKSPETISRLWRVRSRGEEIDLSPSGSASVTLTPKGLE